LLFVGDLAMKSNEVFKYLLVADTVHNLHAILLDRFARFQLLDTAKYLLC